MALKFIYNREYKRVAVLDNSSETGIHFYDDILKTTLATGMYTFEFKVPKHTSLSGLIQIGYYIETRTPQGKQLLLSITNIVENRHGKTVFAEDCSINLINGYVDAIQDPIAPQTIDYYVRHLLDGTGCQVQRNESTGTALLKFGTSQRILERLRQIAKAFSVELDFEVKFEAGSPPELFVNLLKERVEGDRGFRLSSDDVVSGIERTVNSYNVVTALLVKGKQLTSTTSKQAAKAENQTNQPSKGTESVPVNSKVERAITWALDKMGRPYQWGGNGNPNWDCSGLCQGAYEHATGRKINHRATTYTMWAQQDVFRRVSRNELRRGDLILYDGNSPYPAPDHVAIYLGPTLDSPNSIVHATVPRVTRGRANYLNIVGFVRMEGL